MKKSSKASIAPASQRAKPIAGRRERPVSGSDLDQTVTGPSFTSATPMHAPNTPFFAPSRSQTRS